MPQLDFDNTEVAFKRKSDKDLFKASWLFRLVGGFSNKRIARLGAFLANLSLKVKLPFIRWIMFEHFCGGETIEECRAIASALADDNVNTLLDHCVEALATETALDESRDEIIRNVYEAKNSERMPFCVFKVTSVARYALLEKVSTGQAMSEQEISEYARSEARIATICAAAFESNVRMLIDAEFSWLQNAIDDLARKMMALYNKQTAIVFNTFQMYRTDRMAFLRQSHDEAMKCSYFLGVKLVRGAYMESERARATKMGYLSPIHPTEDETHRVYNEAIEYCVDHRDKIALYAGTHNEMSVQVLVDLLEKNSISRDTPDIHFAQLYGMGDNITYILAGEGYNVTKLVPYGKLELAMPYLLRRAIENSAVRGQMGRELRLITLDRKRRQASKRQAS